jgi:hypothetical protein
MNNDNHECSPAASVLRFGVCTLLVAVPAIAIAAVALVNNRDKVQLAANRTADSIKQAGKSFTRAVEPRASHIDRAVSRITEAVRDALSEVRAAVS